MKSKTNDQPNWNFNRGTKSVILAGLTMLTVTQATLASALPTSKLATELASNGNTPLCTAIFKGDVDTVKKFIEYGADVNEVSNGMTPLMFAARYNKVAIVKLLLVNGADKKLKDEKGYTAIKYAELSNSTEALAILKQA